ncbi:ribose 5-phosphate isomerase B [Vagococcus salmoninarum]|uniref:ribose 5-phosphate isomerase B n=1 Tax=Vagococcus salmoninarum TaxID=2739 RepID=UPI003F9AF5E5
MKIGIGADHHGYLLKEILRQELEQAGHEVVDYGCHSDKAVDYPAVAFTVSQSILGEEVERGILICGTGIGMAIAANKIPGIRAAQVTDPYSAERAQLSNDAQIITLGSKITGEEVAKKLVVEYLSHHFKASPSLRKISQITAKETELRQN